MDKSELIKATKELIRQELDGCEESGAYPFLCSQKQTKAGYAYIEKQIIEKMSSGKGMTVLQAMAFIESSN